MKVVIFQQRLFHYRTGLFELMRSAAERRGWTLEVVAGDAYGKEVLKKDEGHLEWAVKVKNVYLPIAGRKDLCWQPLPRHLRDADLLVFMQESRLLSNYWWIARRRLLRGPRVAFWGHGRNFQSKSPAGPREIWKRWSISWVDWWFAYTSITVKILQEGGFQGNRITCLNNSIDVRQTESDWQAASAQDIAEARRRYGLNQRSRVAVFCGSLYSDKKLDLLFAAADRIHAVMPEFVLILIGDGAQRDLVKNITLNRPWIHWEGAQRGARKAIAFGLSELILNPGAVGLNIIDAFAMGLPMITTGVALHGPEIAYLEEGVNGLLIAEDPDVYARAVVELLSKEERLGVMRGAARMSAERYSLEKMAANFVEGLEAACGV